jgi:cytochrome c553
LLEIALLCAGCHGMAGEGRPEAGYPRIHGQPHAYVERQLAAFADGRRPSVVMTPLAQRLSAEQRAALAAHFAATDPPLPTTPSAPSGDRGRTLATTGDNALRVQACQNCHGPDGIGQPPFGPALAGLDAAYLRSELRAWREGSRRSDPSGAMTMIARNLGEDGAQAVAAYYASLAPRRLRGEPLQPSRVVPATPATAGGDGGAAGRGAEGGAATQSGSQGPGGGPTR